VSKIERRWRPFIPTIKAFALHLKPHDAHANSQGTKYLADALRIHRNTISFWLNGKYSPNPAMMVRIDNAAKSYGFYPNKIK